MTKTMRILAVLTGLALLAAAGAAAAQDDNDKYIELIRQDIQAGKTAYMTEGMELTAEQGEIFWPLYRDYLNDLSTIGDRQVALVKDYAANWDSMTQDKAAEIMKASFKNQKDKTALLEKTAKKVAKELDPITAARFVQLERALNLLIDVQLTSEIPLFQKSGGQ
jgi:hypothetical protein